MMTTIDKAVCRALCVVVGDIISSDYVARSRTMRACLCAQVSASDATHWRTFAQQSTARPSTERLSEVRLHVCGGEGVDVITMVTPEGADPPPHREMVASIKSRRSRQRRTLVYQILFKLLVSICYCYCRPNRTAIAYGITWH